MRTVVIPDAIEARDGGGNQIKIELKWFISWILDASPAFNSTGQGLRAAVRIERIMETAPADCASYDFEESDWQHLREFAENPSNGYPISPPRKVLPFVEAIVKASQA